MPPISDFLAAAAASVHKQAEQMAGRHECPIRLSLVAAPREIAIACRADADGIAYRLCEQVAGSALHGKLAATHILLARAWHAGLRGSFLLSVRDVPLSRAPCLAYSSSRPDDVLIPDNQFLASRGYADVRALARDRPWADRDPTIYWRGTTNGFNLQGGDRIAWVRHLAGVPGFDARLTGLCIGARALMPDQGARLAVQLTAEGLMGAPVPFDVHLDYRHHLDLDGTANSFPGLMKKLIIGGAILKQRTGYRQWYYDRLVDADAVIWFTDPADLVRKGHALQADPPRGADLAARARAFGADMDFESELNRCAADLVARAPTLTPDRDPDQAAATPLEPDQLTQPGLLGMVAEWLYGCGDKAGASRILHRALTIEPEGVLAPIYRESRAGLMYRLGMIEAETGNLAAADNTLRRARMLDPAHADLEMSWALVQFRRGLRTKALTVGRRGLRTCPNLAHGWRLMTAMGDTASDPSS